MHLISIGVSYTETRVQVVEKKTEIKMREQRKPDQGKQSAEIFYLEKYLHIFFNPQSWAKAKNNELSMPSAFL